MKHSIATVSLSGTLYQKLEAVSEAGFDGIELFENDLITSPHSPTEIKAYCEHLNLDIMLYQPFRNFEGNPRHQLTHHLKRARKKFELMNQMDIPKILVCSSVLPDTSQSFDVISEDLFQLAEIAKEYDIEIGYEALAWGTVVNSYHQVWEIVNSVNHNNLGIILDSFHSLSINDDLSLIEQIPGEKITFLQLADGPYLKMDVLPWSRHYRNFPGQGDFPLVDFLLPILKTGYTGPLSLEIFNDQFRASPTKKTALDARRSLLYLETLAHDKINQSPLHNAIDAPLEVIPKTISYQKIAYLEFSAFNESATELKSWLSQLGFTYKGSHKYKNISLYAQGETQFLINEEIDSYAYAYYLQHGTSLSSVAFIVDYPEKLYHRAQQYIYPVFDPAIPHSQEESYGIWAPDGSLHYFYSKKEKQLFDDFFLRENAELSIKQPLSLKNIDHYSLGLPAESLASWLLYYRSVLDLGADAELSLPELYGSMKSKLLKSKDQVINIPLNISQDKATQVGRTVSLTHGAGVQHIALTTDNLVNTVRKARQNGVKFLSIPDNYYDDLYARFDLPDQFITTLKTEQILYDEDSQGGSFLHIYTEQFEGRFAIELIERINGYKDYGSQNTPVRIAASYSF